MKKITTTTLKKSTIEKIDFLSEEDLISQCSAYLSIAPWVCKKLREGEKPSAVGLFESYCKFLNTYMSDLKTLSWEKLKIEKQEYQEEIPFYEMIKIGKLMENCINMPLKNLCSLSGNEKRLLGLPENLLEEDIQLVKEKKPKNIRQSNSFKDEKNHTVINKEKKEEIKISFNPFKEENIKKVILPINDFNFFNKEEIKIVNIVNEDTIEKKEKSTDFNLFKGENNSNLKEDPRIKNLRENLLKKNMLTNKKN